MRALVLGAGIVGVTTAYYLARRGCQVTVVERADEVASGASFANGAQLSYNFTESLGGKRFLRRLLSALAGNDRAIRVGLSKDVVPWGLRFLAECTRRNASRNTVALLLTAQKSASLMRRLREDHDLDFAFRPAGKLIVLSSAADVSAARETTELKNRNGANVRLLSSAEAHEIEPALASMKQPLAGALYAPDDEVGDARAFAEHLRRCLEDDYGVSFRLRHEARAIHTRGDRVRAVDCGVPLEADAVVVCTGAWSASLLRQHGIDAGIYPVRGYSVTLPVGAATPDVSYTSLRNRFVMSRLGDRVRIAGFTDFCGFKTSNDPARIQTLIATAKRVAPDAARYDCDDPNAWGGFRPMTPSGRPVVGPTKVRGLFLNTGHGMLGWTLACGTADAVAEAVVQSLRQ